jgi:hypothetical protein
LDAKPSANGAVALSWSLAQDNGSGVFYYEVWCYIGL